MSDDDVTERARQIVTGAMFGLTTPMMVDAIVSDLADAGLLVTPEHDRQTSRLAWSEGFGAGRGADHNPMWWPRNPYRREVGESDADA